MSTSTFAPVELSKRGLNAQQTALSTTGHNISNADRSGYSRERVVLSAARPLDVPGLNRAMRPGQIGQGVTVVRIERVHSNLLETRLLKETTISAFWSHRSKNLLPLEKLYNEPSDVSLRANFDRFWASWQELATSPTSPEGRQMVQSRGKALVASINHRYLALSDLRKSTNSDITSNVKEINDILAQIGDLNKEIVNVKAEGNNPNDLLDSRDKLTEKLATYVPIELDLRDPDEPIITTMGRHLVQGRVVHYLNVTPAPGQNEGDVQVTWGDDGSPLIDHRALQVEAQHPSGGKLLSLLTLRDIDIRGEIAHVDSMALDFSTAVNQLHKNATTANGEVGVSFFTNHPVTTNIQGLYDTTGNGAFDHRYLFSVTGSEKMKLTDRPGLDGAITLSGQTGNVTVRYNAQDSVDSIIQKINHSGAEVKAYLTQDGQLRFKGTPSGNPADPNFVIRALGDTGRFLSQYAGLLNGGVNGGQYDWTDVPGAGTFTAQSTFTVAPLEHPSAWLKLSDKVKGDYNNIASAPLNTPPLDGKGDGTIALKIALLRERPVIAGTKDNFDDFFASAVAHIGLQGEEAKQANASHAKILTEIQTEKTSYSSVNLDEEFANITKFQKSYAAVARFLTTMNTIYDTLLQIKV